jgi:hypothetical protein
MDSVEFPSKNEFLNFTMTKPLEPLKYAYIMPNFPQSSHTDYYWTLVLSAAALIMWIVYRLLSHSFIRHTRLEKASGKALNKLAPGVSSADRQRRLLKAQLLEERLTGVRFLAPVDWLIKGNIRSLGIALLQLSLVCLIVSGLLTISIQSNFSQSTRNLPFIYFDSASTFIREFVASWLASVSLDSILGSLLFLGLIGLRSIVYVFVGFDLDLLESIFSVSLGYKLFWYSLLRLFFFPLLDLMKRSYPKHLVASGSSWEAFAEFIIPFSVDHEAAQATEANRQAKLLQLRNSNSQLYDDLMQYKNNLQSELSIPRSLVFPWLVDAVKRIILAIEFLALIIIVALLIRRILNWRRKIYKVKKEGATAFIPDWQCKVAQVSRRPEAIVKTLLNYPLTPEDLGLTYVDQLILPAAFNSTSTSATSSLTSVQDVELTTVYKLQESGELSTCLNMTSFYISVLASWMASLFLSFCVLVFGIIAPLIEPNQAFLIESPIIFDIYSTFLWLSIIWRYINVIVILVPSSTSKILYILQRQAHFLESQSNIYYNGPESLFFRLHRIQNSFLYSRGEPSVGVKAPLRQSWLEETLASPPFNDPSLEARYGGHPSRKLSAHLPAWVDQPLTSTPMTSAVLPPSQSDGIHTENRQDISDFSYVPPILSGHTSHTLPNRTELSKIDELEEDGVEDLKQYNNGSAQDPLRAHSRSSVIHQPHYHLDFKNAARNPPLSPYSYNQRPPAEDDVSCGSSCTCQGAVISD